MFTTQTVSIYCSSVLSKDRFTSQFTYTVQKTLKGREGYHWGGGGGGGVLRASPCEDFSERLKLGSVGSPIPAVCRRAIVVSSSTK